MLPYGPQMSRSTLRPKRRFMHEGRNRALRCHQRSNGLTLMMASFITTRRCTRPMKCRSYHISARSLMHAPPPISVASDIRRLQYSPVTFQPPMPLRYRYHYRFRSRYGQLSANGPSHQSEHAPRWDVFWYLCFCDYFYILKRMPRYNCTDFIIYFLLIALFYVMRLRNIFTHTHLIIHYTFILASC
jgi:hypothetical protein